MLKTAIISFLPDCIAVPLTAEMQRASYKGKALTFQQICSRAYKASSDPMTKVAIPLQFGRNIGQDSASKLIQFNSIQTVNKPILKPKQTIVNGYNRMCHTGFPLYTSPCYPQFPPPPPEARGQMGPEHGANDTLYCAPMPHGKQLASVIHRRTPAHVAGESQETQQWRESIEVEYAAEQHGLAVVTDVQRAETDVQTAETDVPPAGTDATIIATDVVTVKKTEILKFILEIVARRSAIGITEAAETRGHSQGR
jgi:hypothetical protein